MADAFVGEREELSPEAINLTLDESRGTGPQAEDLIKTWGSGDVNCVELDTNMRKDVLRSFVLISNNEERHELPIKLFWNSFKGIELIGDLDRPMGLIFKTVGGETKVIRPQTDLKELKEIFGNMVIGGEKLNNNFTVDVKQTSYETP